MNISRTFAFSFLVEIIIASKLTNRFANSLVGFPQIHLASLEIPGVLSMNEEKAGSKAIHRLIRRIFYGLNMTLVDPKTFAIGEYDKYGNYSGVVGIVQRGVADIAVHLLRPDSTPFEPVKIGPVLSSSEARIYTRRQEPAEKQVDVLYVVHNFDQVLYMFIGVAILISIAVMTSAMFFGHKKLKPKYLFKYLYKTIRECCDMMLDQEFWEPKEWSTRFMWIAVNIFALIVIYAYLLNFMSSDQVAEVPPDVIDSLDDLQDARWRQQNVTPLMPHNIFLHTALRHSRNTTREGAKFQQIRRRSDLVYIKTGEIFADPGAMANFSTMIRRKLYDNTIAILLSEFIMDNLFVTGACRLDAEIAQMFYTSKESFAGGVLSLYFNKRFDSELTKYVEQRLRTAIEGDIIMNMLRGIVEPAIEEIVSLNTGLSVLECLAGFANVHAKDRAKQIVLTLQGLRQLFIIIAYGICLSAALLFCEVTWKRLWKVARMWRRRRQETNVQKRMRIIQIQRHRPWRKSSRM